jgi:hypothetical protein
MGHCAPTVMQTILDAEHDREDWPVRLVAGLPGGIGNTGHECGGITAPLLALGRRSGSPAPGGELPELFYQGEWLCQRFLRCNGTLYCSQIRRGWRVPLPCIPVIRRSPELAAAALAAPVREAITSERERAYGRLYNHLAGAGFHCAWAVFQQLGGAVPQPAGLPSAVSAFTGGTLFKGLTCSALAAGVMALGLRLGEIENSPRRVLVMILTMAAGGDAFADDLNHFNRMMNLGNRLGSWFASEFGSTQCREITLCDFSSTAGVLQYIDTVRLSRCRAIAEAVAGQVLGILESVRNDERSGVSNP